jgi:hypothetical protein
VLGIGDGSWTDLEREVRRVGADGGRPPSDAVKAAGVAWRRSRRLLAGADLRAWLAARDLDTARWRGFLERRVALDGTPAPGDLAPIDGDVLLALVVDVRCSGLLDRLARQLLAGAAAERALERRRPAGDGPARAAAAAGSATGRATGLAPADLAAAAERVDALEAAYATFAAERVPDDLIDGRIRERRLAWTALAWDEVDFRTEGAAREAAFMVELDGCELAEPARLAGCRSERHRAEIGRLTGEVGRRLVAAVPRQVIGPWSERGGWPVLRVVERTEPVPIDPDHRSRARAELVDELLVPHRAGGRVLA